MCIGFAIQWLCQPLSNSKLKLCDWLTLAFIAAGIQADALRQALAVLEAGQDGGPHPQEAASLPSSVVRALLEPCIS